MIRPIRFTGAYCPERDMTVGRHYTPLAFSKNYDSYRVKDDAGFTGWHYMKNFELVKEERK